MITSRKNELVKDIRALMTKSSERKKRKCFIAEGLKMFREAPVTDIIKAVYSESFGKDHEDVLNFIKENEIPFEILSDDVFSYISDTVTPQGIMTFIKKKHYETENLLKGEETFVLLLEATQDPGNLGAMLRSAEAAGASGIVMGTGTVDITSPKVVRASMGAVFRLPHLTCEDFCNTVIELKKNNVRIFATSPDTRKSLFDARLDGAVGFMIGNESNGLSDEAFELADELISIPMGGSIESLNAASAATLCMYEVFRRRMGN